MTITIIDFPFDSLVTWSDPYDILEVHPYLTIQEARIASKFHQYKDVGMKARFLYNLVTLLSSHSNELSMDQLMLVYELVNFESGIKQDLVNAFNKIAEQQNEKHYLVLGER